MDFIFKIVNSALPIFNVKDLFWTVRTKFESQHTLVLIPTTSSKANLSESSEKNNVHINERVPYSCQSNTVTSESVQSQFLMHSELSETQAQITSTKQIEDTDSSVLLETPDIATCPDPVLTILAQFDPLKKSSSNEVPIVIDKMSSDFSQKEISFSEDTLTTTQIKPFSETTEVNIQEPMSESGFASETDKQVDHCVTRQKNDSTSEISSLVSCPRMENVAAKDHLSDKIPVDSSATFNCHYSGDYLQGERVDQTSTQDCDISVLETVGIYVSNIDASETTTLKQEESGSEPAFDLLVEENKMYRSGELQQMDRVIETSQNDDDSQSEKSLMVHLPKVDGQTKQKDLTLCFQQSTVAQDLDFMTNPTVEYPEDFNILSESITSEKVPLNQAAISKEPTSELGSDKPSPIEHQGSFDEDDQPLNMLIQNSRTVNETPELSFMVSWPKMDSGQQKESLTSKDSEKDDSNDVFNENDNKPFKNFASSQDFDVPATASVEEIDMFHASSKAAPEAVSSRFFGFEELLPTSIVSPINDDNPRSGSQYSEDSVATVDVFESRTSLYPDLVQSPSENEYCIPPGYDEVSITFDCNAVQIKAASPTFELSDTEAYFDCKQGASDFSETESEEPVSQLHQQPYTKKPRNVQPTLLPYESEDYEDSPFTYEPLYNVQEENEEDSSDEEFTLCEAPPKTIFCEIGARDSDDDDDDTNESMSREIKAELGTLSESSDDEFLTTRIIRRRVIIKADEMADFPPQSVTEETYLDENGHTVVKKVTRRVIRKCASSSDGAGPEQVSSEAGAHSSNKTSQGDGYSKVVKRTVVKSEGDQSEVTFAEYESLSKQDKAEGRKASRVERTAILEGERTMTPHSDASLASDLPSAQDNIKQALSYISSFHETELPRVAHREPVKDGGTLVKRGQMNKGRLMRWTTVKGAGQRKQVLLDGPGLGSKSSDLKQHLHQLFHRSYEQNHGEDIDEENN